MIFAAKQHRCVAQFGRALRSGRRGRKFKSCRIEKRKKGCRSASLFPFLDILQNLCQRALCPGAERSGAEENPSGILRSDTALSFGECPAKQDFAAAFRAAQNQRRDRKFSSCPSGKKHKILLHRFFYFRLQSSLIRGLQFFFCRLRCMMINTDATSKLDSAHP